MQKLIKQMAIDDINFNLNGHATYSQAKAIIQICKIVYGRVEDKHGRF